MSGTGVIASSSADRQRLMTLAESVSFAVVVDRPLLRAARLQFVPDADASLEADFWFASLIRTRAADGVALLPDAADELRRRVAEDPQRLQAVWDLTLKMHARLPQTLKLEEEIAYLSVSSGDAAVRRIETLLRSALAAMVDGGRDQLANWAARLMANLPTSVRMLPSARLLDAGARLRLGGDASAAGSADLPLMPWMTPPALPRDQIGVRFTTTGLSFDAAAEPQGVKMAVPRTRPLLLRLAWTSREGEARSAQVTLRRGEQIAVDVSANEVAVTTLTGESYSLRRGGSTPESVASAVIDFEALIARKSGIEILGGENDLTDILTAIEARVLAVTNVLVTGVPGSGKTTFLARLAADLTKRGTTRFTHFFEPGTPRLEDFELARRSLIAQMISRFDLPASMLSMALHDFIQAVSGRVSSAPIVIILDNVDGVRGADIVDNLATLAKLPAPFVVVVSARPDFKMPGVSLRIHTDATDVAELARKLYNLNMPSGHFGALDLIISAQTRFSNPRIESMSSVYENDLTMSPNAPLLRAALAALAVSRAPLPFSDAKALASIDRADRDFDVSQSAFITSFQHEGELSVAIVNGAATDFLRAIASQDVTKSHLDLATVVATPGRQAPIVDVPVEEVSVAERAVTHERLSWYGLMHGPFHWQRAGWQNLALQQMGRADLLRRRIAMFGAHITTNYCDEIALGGNARGPQFDLLVAALRKNEARLDAAPDELVPLLYPTLRDAGVSDAEIGMLFSIPDEALPSLRVVRREKGKGSGFRLNARVSKLRALPKRILLAALEDNSVLLFQPFDRLSSPAAILGFHSERITALAGAGDWAASASANGSLCFWSLVRPALDTRQDDLHQSEVVALLAGEDRCVSCGADGKIAAWEMTRGTKSRTDRWTLRWQAQLQSAVTAASLSSKSGTIIAGCLDGSIVTLNEGTGDVVTNTPAHRGPVAAITAYGGSIVSAGSDRMLCIADLASGELTSEFPTGHEMGIAGIAVSQLGKMVVTWSADRTARIFSTRRSAGKAPLVVLSPHRAAITSAAFIGNDAILTCSADGTAAVARRNGGIVFRFEEHDGPIRACTIAWSVEMHPIVITASDDRRILAWRGSDGVITSEPSPAVTRIGAVSGGATLIRRGQDVQIRTRISKRTVKAADFAVSEDGEEFAIAERRRISLYRASAGLFGPRRTFAVREPVRALDLAGGTVFAASASGGFYIFAGRTGKLTEHVVRITAMRPFGHGVSGLMLGGLDGQVWQWGSPLQDFTPLGSSEGRVTAIGVSSTAQVVSAASDGSLIRWTPGWETIRGKTDIVRVRHILMKDDFVFCAGDDGAIESFTLIDLQRVGRLDAHRDAVTGMCFDPKRNLLFTASADGTIRAWEGERPIATYYGDVPFTALALVDGEIVAGDEAGGVLWLSFGPPQAVSPQRPRPKRSVARKKKVLPSSSKRPRILKKR